MGWNDSRVYLVTPGWKLVGQDAPTGAKSISGERVQILHSERLENEDSKKISHSDACNSLWRRNFRVVQFSQQGDRLQWQDVEAAIELQDENVKGMTLTFTLTRDSPGRLNAWISLVSELCKSLGLSLYDTDHGFPVGTDQFLGLLQETAAGQEFAVKYDWPSILGN